VNTLYYGDNLTIMRERAKDSVDMIYLDPPFNSKRDYNLLYKTLTGKPVPEQVDAFCDTWEMDADKERRMREMPVLLRENGVEDYYIDFWRLWMQALRNTQPHLLAYLIYMVERLLHMKVMLRPTGSIYLHCDPTASHYIKVMMDAIFGHQNFRNEIIWKRTSAHSSADRCGPVHDVILFYSKTDHYKWKPIYQEYDKTYTDAFYTHVDPNGDRWRRSDLTGAGTRNGETGHVWRGINITARGRHWAYPPSVLEKMDAAGKIHWPKKEGGMPMLKRYLKEQLGTPLQDIWTDIGPMHNLSPERLGYATQKPLPLLRRIIDMSTDAGDIVFDPFCGCGTTIYAAVEAKRKWMGCDIAVLSIQLVKKILGQRYGLVEDVDYEVDGVPVSVEQAQLLFRRDPFQFQHWAVEAVGGFPMHKKSGDKGIDGRIYFETHDGLRHMVLSVKGGGVRPTDIRDLRGVLEREEEALLAGFISLQEPTKAMREEASRADTLEYGGTIYPRIQLLTVADILEGKHQFNTPSKVGIKGQSGQARLALRPRTRNE
jgi:DNA modification methylase